MLFKAASNIYPLHDIKTKPKHILMIACLIKKNNHYTDKIPFLSVVRFPIH